MDADDLATLGASLTKGYRQVSNIRRTESQHLNYSRTVLRLYLPNPFEARC